MDAFINAVKGHAAGMDAQAPGNRWGFIASVDPMRHRATVTLQPEGILTGWLPIATLSAGQGWGVLHMPMPGTMAHLSPEQGTDGGDLVITGFAHNDTAQAPQVTPYGGGSAAPLAPGETALVHPSGGYIRLRAGGVIESSGTWKHTGDFLASGEITDLNNAHGSLDALRQAHNPHTHNDPQGGNTSGPNLTV